MALLKYCNRTTENFPTVDYDGSATFSLNNATFELYVTGDSLTIYNFEMGIDIHSRWHSNG